MSYMRMVIIFFAITLLNASIQAQIPYSFETLLKYKSDIQGFSYSSFENSMDWKRDETDKEFFEDRDVKAVIQNFIGFCQNFEHLPQQDYSTVPAHFSIPPIIHLIWIGSDIPKTVGDAFDSWRKHHPNWEIKVWGDTEVANFDWSSEKIQQAFIQADTWAEKADILRLEVLYKFGGIYSDADVVCINSFHDLVVQDIAFFSCFELNYVGKHYGEPFFVGSAVLGAAKNSHVIKYCLDHLKTAEEAPSLGIIKRTGPGLISRACQEVLSNKKENILILPCSYFYPLPWKKRDTTSESVASFVSSDTLAIHLWDGSWCPPKKKPSK